MPIFSDTKVLVHVQLPFILINNLKNLRKYFFIAIIFIKTSLSSPMYFTKPLLRCHSQFNVLFYTFFENITLSLVYSSIHHSQVT